MAALRCNIGSLRSFETIIEEYNLKDPALHELAKIIHAADTQDVEASAEGAGLNAIMIGIRMNSKDDYKAIEKAQPIYDALYAYSKLKLIREKHKVELNKMDRKQQQKFIKNKMQEKL